LPFGKTITPYSLSVDAVWREAYCGPASHLAVASAARASFDGVPARRASVARLLRERSVGVIIYDDGSVDDGL
jgi:hypothetical protein